VPKFFLEMEAKLKQSLPESKHSSKVSSKQSSKKNSEHNSRAQSAALEEKKSRESSTDSSKSKASNAKESAVRVDSRMSKYSINKELHSESKHSIASNRSENSRNLSVHTSDFSRKKSLEKELRSESRQSKLSIKSKQDEKIEKKSANASMSSLRSEKKTRDDWIVRVYTSDLFGKKFEGTDAKVYISLIGTKNETEKFWLNETNATTNNQDLFEEGQMDEFHLTTNADLKILNSIRIGHDNTNTAAGWHLDRVEVINKKDGNVYMFMCKRWLAKGEDDGQIERVLSVRANSRFADESIKITSRKSSASSVNSQNLKVSRPASKTSKHSSSQLR
jgi:hypothetical protein